VPYEADFYVGQIRFAVSGEAVGSGKGGPSPVLIIAAVVALALAAVSMLAPNDDLDGARVASLKLPDVFTPAACQAEPGKLAYAAQDAERAAMSKRERAVFDPHDGVQAGQLFQQAEACYTAAGDAAGAARAKAQGEPWRQKLLADASATRVRLEVALEQGSNAQALREVRSLLRLFEGEKDTSIDELKRHERRLAALLSKSQK
jgi:hypothetical protein